MALPEAAFPEAVSDGNEQDTSNDVAGSTAHANAADHNEHSAEIIELQRAARAGVECCINKTGGALTCFKMMETDGVDDTTGLLSIKQADADAADYLNLVGMLVMEKGGDVDTVADDEPGYVVGFGPVRGLDTSSFSAGDLLWLAASGALTKTRDESQFPVAQVLHSDASNGELFVFCGGPLAHMTSAQLNGALFGSVVTDQLTANTNDYDPTGLATAAALRLNTDGAGYNLTGVTAPATGGRLQLMVFNFDAAQVITLKDEDANSAAANRLALGGDIALGHDEGCTLFYDVTSSRWRCCGRHN